ncbi:MAG: phenylalanine--tRNA ligase subunit beta [Candidatus Riflebacteria bacterium]|nr:phenylalanine--tRNA ligase subunit beta [Candidatus Riflebacteria bacterium]
MKLLLSWLRDYIDLKIAPEKISDALNMAGIEVEEMTNPGLEIKGVVTGKILAKAPHPHASKLSICDVDVGKTQMLTIVCGANNMKPGDIVPVAQIGATLPGGIEIRQAEIRGIQSFGMMCSKKELGISTDHSGLYILPPDTPIGKDVVDYLSLNDTIFEISITPNRGDALSHLGLARELSAIFNLPLHRDALDNPQGEGDITKITSVTNDTPNLCHRYGARVIKNVKIGPSPRWLQDRLEKIGIRPINNIVDVTNFVMMDIGHPLHAFDFDKLDGNQIVVRTAHPDEKFKTLDDADTERKLDPTMLVIADKTKAVALAGVMGGKNSEVNQQTTTVLLEAAWFDPICVRKTAKTLGMMSESSYRFERGTNIENIPIALNLAARMILETAGGTLLNGIIDNYPTPFQIKKILVRPRRVCQILGVEMKPAQIETILHRLKMEVQREGESILVGVPPFRHDIEQEADLIEEIARLFGYDNLPTTLSSIPSVPQPMSRINKLQEQITEHLVSLGFYQILTYSFTPNTVPHEFQEGLPLMLKNPLSEEHGALRTNLVWGMFDAIKKNIMNDEYDITFFEMGRVFQRSGENIHEPDRLSIGICGRTNPRDWKKNSEQADLFHIKGVIESIGKLSGFSLEFRPSNRSFLHPAKQMEVRLKGQFAGYFGQIHPTFLDNKKMPPNILLAELDLSTISALSPEITKMKPVPDFPPIRRDLAFVLPTTTKFEEILGIINTEGKGILEYCNLFDLYQGKGIPEGCKSLAFSLSFRSLEKTLTDEEVNPRIEAIIKKVESQFQGKLRE